MTKVREWIKKTAKKFEKASLFYGHGTDNAIDEAYFLLAGANNLLDLEREDFEQLLLSDLPLKMEEIEQLVELRIKKRLPIPYLLEYTLFADLPFCLNPNVLIPRSPFSELIMKQFQPLVNLNKLNSILDLGTGSGCMAIAAAKYLPGVKVDAVDLSLSALDCARENGELNEVLVNFWQSDLFSEVNGRYDLIITNPPYVGKLEMETLPMEYSYEPQMALLGGENGDEIINRIIEGAVDHLTEHGQLIIEVGNSLPLIEKHYKIPFIQLLFEFGESEILLFEQQDLKLVGGR